MGVELTHYLVWGVKLPDELHHRFKHGDLDIFDEKYEPYLIRSVCDIIYSLLLNKKPIPNGRGIVIRVGNCNDTAKNMCAGISH